MALTLQVGQTGTLVFMAREAGFDPTKVTNKRWSTTGDQTKVKLTAPDQVEGIAPGSASFKCMVAVEGSPNVPYYFDITCVAPPPTTPPIAVPVTIDQIVTPPPAP